jgi:hypothetical protein
MTRKTIAKIASAMFVILGLYGTAAQAGPEIKTSAEQAFTQKSLVITMTSAKNSLANHTAYPSITSELFKDYGEVSLPSASQRPRQPLPGIKVTDFALFSPQNLQQKNSIFEFAAKFNDTLQQILAYFDFTSASTGNKKKQIDENKQQRKIQLIVNHNKSPITDNCQAKASAKNKRRS